MTNNNILTTTKWEPDVLALLLVSLFALPILGQAVPFVNTLPGDLTTYELLFIIPLGLAALLRGVRCNDFTMTQKAVLAYCLYSTTCLTIKFAIYGMGPARVGLQLYRERTLGPWFALGLFFVFAAIRGPAERTRFLKRFVQGIALVFILQFLLSLNETITGHVFERAQTVLYEQIDQRDSFSKLGSGGISSLGLHYALNGLVREFDAYGIQLIFYNLLFLTQLTRRIRWMYVLLCVCVLAASILNTTKTAIITIAMSDFAFLALQEGRLRAFRFISIVTGVVSALLLYRSELLGSILYAGAGEATMYVRFDIWRSLWEWYVRNVFAELWNLPLGFSFSDLIGVPSIVMENWNASTQSEFILELLNIGVIGLALFLFAFFIAPFGSFRELPKQDRLVFLFVPASLLAASITMDLETTYYVFPLVAFIILYLGSRHDQSEARSRLRQNPAISALSRNRSRLTA